MRLDMLKLMMKSKKKILDVFNGSLDIFNINFLLNLVGAGHSFFNLF